MKEYYLELSIGEIASRIRKVERTAYRWIEQGKIQAQDIGANRYRIAESELLKFLPTSAVEEYLASLEALKNRLEALEGRIDMLETHLQALEYRFGHTERRLDALEVQKMLTNALESTPDAPVPVLAPQTQPHSEKPARTPLQSQEEVSNQGLPPGLVGYTDFYRSHHITSGVADRARGKKFFPVQVGNWHDERGHPVTLALDALGQWNFCVYFKTRGKLRECSRQGCACHEKGGESMETGGGE